MAKSKVVAKYGTQFHSIAARAAETLTFTFETKQQAQAFRFDLYGFRRALETEGATEMYPDFARAKIRVEENKLIIAPPEELPPEIIAAIEVGLKKPSNPATVPTAEPAPQTWTPPPPPVDPYEAYLRTPEAPAAAPAPPVDPFDLTETRGKIDSFTTAVTAWLGGSEAEK